MTARCGRVTTEPLAGHVSLQLADTPSGWQPGDRLVVPDSRQLRWNQIYANYSPQYEEPTLASVSGASTRS